LEVMGDQGHLERVFFNLLSNAHKYAPDGSVVWLTAYAHDGMVRVTVCDEGPGIAKKHQPLLFNRFYRVDDSRARKKGSSGLGLAICKHIVENHQGSIEVQSEEGQGASFIVTLPLSSHASNHQKRMVTIQNLT